MIRIEWFEMDSTSRKFREVPEERAVNLAIALAGTPTVERVQIDTADGRQCWIRQEGNRAWFEL